MNPQLVICDRTNMAYTCKIFGHYGHYTQVCTVFKVTGMNTEKNMYVYQIIHKWSLMIKNNYGHQMHST